MKSLSEISLKRKSKVGAFPVWAVILGVLLLASSAPQTRAQDTPPPTPRDNIRFGYIVHQSIDMGGHLADHSGSSAMYDTLVNMQSGPRVLSSSLDLRSVNPARAVVFDHLSTSGFGFGGDPNSASLLNMSKGRIYDFRANLRRDRQYFDNNLLANPLIPAASVPFVPVLDSPHRYNTVRHMTDLSLTLAPLSRISGRIAYSQNSSQGPSYSSVHYGSEALLLQNFRNATDTYSAGLDWNPVRGTTLSYDQYFIHYKGDTNWNLTGLDYRLSNGTPVSLGLDLSSVWKAPCAAPFSKDGSVNPACNAYLGYRRFAPTRTLTPTEQLRFQSSSVPHFTFNGRLLYSGTKSNLNNFNEVFTGLESRVALRQAIITGSAVTKRVDVNGDLSIQWQITPRIIASNLFDFWNFRVPGSNILTETDYAGKSLLAAPGAITTTTTPDAQFLNQKTKTNTFLVAWDVLPTARVSAGFRYRSRIITNAGGDFIPIHEDWAIFGAALRPTPQWRLNLDVDVMYADKSYTRTSPRQMQHYRVRSTYQPQKWMTFSGSINLREARNNVQTVNHLEHNRDFSFGAVIAPSQKWSLDLNYGYDSVYSSTLECYTSSNPPPTAGLAPADCVAAGTPFTSTGYYNSPTQFGAFGFTLQPEKRVHLAGGYQMSAVNGSTDVMNVNQVLGSLNSGYQSPYGRVVVDLAQNWSWRADYNYYGYSEGATNASTPSRTFRGNVYTIGVHYAF